MSKVIRRVLIVTKTGQEDAAALGREVAGFLGRRAVSAEVVENEAGQWPEDPDRNYDLILVLGGDGTMLSVARRLDGPGAPLLGINLGKVGFLAEMCPDDWPQTLSTILDKGAVVRERMALSFEILRQDRVAVSGRAINDLVINRGALSRLVNLHLHVDGQYMGLLRSDGLIMSTPMGSTGYGVSARGPILHPGIEGFGVTPICPFLNEFPPLVLPAASTLTAVVLPTTAEVFLTVDGQEVNPLREGDRVVARRSPRGLTFVQVEGASYFAKLRAKGFIREHAMIDSGSCLAPEAGQEGGRELA